MRLLRSTKLRANIFFSFLSILLLSETVIFGFFFIIETRRHETEMGNLSRTMNLIFTELIRVHLPGRAATRDPRAIGNLQQLLVRLRRQNPYFTHVWMEDQQGKVILSTFSGPPPRRTLQRVNTIDRMTFFHARDENGAKVFLVTVDIELNDGSSLMVKAYINLLHRLERKDILFLLGLLGITLAVGPIALYVSKAITRPLKELTRTAHQVSLGDLSVRAKVRTRDEIGDLAVVFNGMLDMLEKIIHNTRELAANISHELRTPLTRILISRELLEDHLDRYREEFFAKHLGLIRQDVEKMDGMITRILFLSKLEVQPGLEVPRRLELGLVGQALLTAFSGVLHPDRFALAHSFEERLFVAGNEDDLTTALSNLLDNAVKYGTPRTTITFTMARVEENAVITLRNTLSPDLVLPEDPDRLFEPFFRVTSGTRRGSGLGMAIAARVVHKMQGTIHAAVREGTFEVVITLPLII